MFGQTNEVVVLADNAIFLEAQIVHGLIDCLLDFLPV